SRRRDAQISVGSREDASPSPWSIVPVAVETGEGACSRQIRRNSRIARSSSSVSTAVSKGAGGMTLPALHAGTFGHLAEPLYTTGPCTLSRRETDTPRERDFCERRTGAPCP